MAAFSAKAGWRGVARLEQREELVGGDGPVDYRVGAVGAFAVLHAGERR